MGMGMGRMVMSCEGMGEEVGDIEVGIRLSY